VIQLTSLPAVASAKGFAADGFPMRSTVSSPSLPRTSGFLVEAVVLASLVGIVAAFAVPHFTRLGNGVRASAVITLGAKLRRAAQAAHARSLSSGSPLSAMTMAGKTVILRNGYPDATANGIRNAIFDSDGFTTSEGTDSVTFIRVDAPSAKQCSITYRAAPNTGSAATITDPDTRGC
jgi:MSHA pilin protein MshA